MLVIEPKDLEVTKKGLLRVFYSHLKGDTSMQDAYDRAVQDWERNGYSCRWKTFDGFRVNVLCAQRKDLRKERKFA